MHARARARTDGRQHDVEALGLKALRKVLQEARRHRLDGRPLLLLRSAHNACVQCVQQLQRAPLHRLPRLRTAKLSPQ
jgi:hypothetical protein